MRSRLQDFLFLRRRGRIDLGDRVVGHLLDFGAEPFVLVFADLVLLLVGLEAVHAVAAYVAHGDPRLFRILAGELGQFLAPLLGEVRDRQRSEEHTSELQSLMRISYAVFCLKKTNTEYTNKQ